MVLLSLDLISRRVIEYRASRLCSVGALGRGMIHLPSGTGKGVCDFIVLLKMAYDVNCRDYLFQELVIQHFQIAVDHRSLRLWTDSRTSENGGLSLEEIKQQVQDSRSSQFSSLCLYYKVLCKAGSHSVNWPRTPHTATLASPFEGCPTSVSRQTVSLCTESSKCYQPLFLQHPGLSSQEGAETTQKDK